MSTPTPTPTAPPLPTGAYILRNRHTSTVLHTQAADATPHSTTTVHAHQQDEGQFRDQQIWWIEPLAAHPAGAAYSITHPGSGRALEADPEYGSVFSKQYCGSPAQRWSLRAARDPLTGEVSYTIANVLTDKVLDLPITSHHSSTDVRTATHTTSPPSTLWEFAIPVVAFPPGWFHIQAYSTGRLLSHDYAHNAPTLLPAPSRRIPPELRSTWQFQWTLCHAKCFLPRDRTTWHRPTPIPVERNSWHLVNRLTRAPLCPYLAAMSREESVARDDARPWRLELDRARVWKLTNRATGRVLTQVAGGGVSCVSTPDAARQRWILRSLDAAAAPRLPTTPPRRYIPVNDSAVTTLLLRSTLRMMRGRLRT